MRLRRVVMPETAKPGQIIEIKALIAHPMVPGHTASGTNQVARRIVKSVVVRKRPMSAPERPHLPRPLAHRAAWSAAN